LIENAVHVFELGDAFDILVSVVEIVVGRMAETLMPE